MKKSFVGVAMAVLLVTSCGGVGTNTGSSSASSSNSSASASNGGSVLGSIIGSAANGETLGNVITSVLGIDKLSQKSLVGTWKYKGPGCAFTSHNTLAKAGKGWRRGCGSADQGEACFTLFEAGLQLFQYLHHV